MELQQVLKVVLVRKRILARLILQMVDRVLTVLVVVGAVAPPVAQLLQTYLLT
jgi:hypothetical protein